MPRPAKVSAHDVTIIYRTADGGAQVRDARVNDTNERNALVKAAILAADADAELDETAHILSVLVEPVRAAS